MNARPASRQPPAWPMRDSPTPGSLPALLHMQQRRPIRFIPQPSRHTALRSQPCDLRRPNPGRRQQRSGSRCRQPPDPLCHVLACPISSHESLLFGNFALTVGAAAAAVREGAWAAAACSVGCVMAFSTRHVQGPGCSWRRRDAAGTCCLVGMSLDSLASLQHERL